MAAMLVGTVSASAAPVGKLTFQSCLTSEIEAGPVPEGSGACGVVGELEMGGSDTGLDNVESVAVSPNGRSLYATAGEDDALMRFDRNRNTGQLSFAFCFTGEAATTSPCEELPESGVGGADSGLDDPEAVTVAPDGRSVYATSRSDAAIAIFDREPDGFLTWVGCISGDSGTGPSGTGACAQLPQATSGADNSGLDDPKQKELAISNDGEHVYAVSDLDDAVIHFSRNPNTSTLTFEECITGEEESGPGVVGTDACMEIPTPKFGGVDSGLNAPRWAELARGGRTLYVAADQDDAIARFDRNTNSGELTYRDCITGDTGTGPAGTGSCRGLPLTGTNGELTGLDRPLGLVAKGDSLYAISGADAALAHFSMNASGRLRYEGCLSGEEETGPAVADTCKLIPSATPGANASGMEGLRDLELKGQSLYATGQFDSSLVTFRRNPDTGSVKFVRCLTGDGAVGPTESGACQIAGDSASLGGAGSGLEKLETIAVSSDGRNVYGAAEQDSAISRFKRKR